MANTDPEKVIIHRNGKVTLDGEVIGKWIDDPNDLLMFFPKYARQPAVITVLRGEFRADVVEWLKKPVSDLS